MKLLVIIGIVCCSAVMAQDNLWANRLSRARSLARQRTTVAPQFKPGQRLGAQPAAAAVPSISPSNIIANNDEWLSRAVGDLAFRIGQIAADDTSAVEIYSPVSIMGVLNMLLLGSDGITRNELLGTLKLGSKTKMNEYHQRAASMLKNLLQHNSKELDRLDWKGQSCINKDIYEDDYDEELIVPIKPKELKITNAIFTQNNLPVSSKYTQLAQQLYDAQTRQVDFRNSKTTTDIINKWVTEATKGKINQITNGRFPTNTNMVIASSLYFKANWQKEFLFQATKPRKFYPNGNDQEPISVESMVLVECLPYIHDKGLDIRMIALPYADNATTMYVIMPQNSTRANIRRLQNLLTTSRVDAMIAKMTRRSTTVTFPRMQLSSSTSLEKVFRRLGLKSIFSPQHSQLYPILDQQSEKTTPLFVSDITHKVSLNIDEQGTEGAAVTVTLIDRIGSPVIFNVNQPFLIYLRHDPTRLPIFYGAVFDPRG